MKQQRIITFRAWDKNKKKMLYLNHDDEGSWSSWGDIIFPYAQGDGNLYDLMQYTGLKDKNGKEIYEGDVMQAKVTNASHFKVIWNYDAWRLLRYCNGVEEEGNYYGFIENLEVIGNIYENSELLNFSQDE